MTPGFARPRSELPWIPYESLDRVIINAHNFTPAGPRGIGGEIAWWCPSLDDSGNGTATINDLSGNSRNMTLTNMTPASDWVSDTGASGVRAVDYDGVNDYSTAAGVSGALSGAAECAVSLWVKPQVAIGSNKGIFGSWSGQGGNGNNQIAMVWSSASAVIVATVNASGTQVNTTGTSSFSINTWYHILVTVAATVQTIYINGTSVGSSARSGLLRSSTEGFDLGGYTRTNQGNQLIDDARVFLRIPTAGERAALASRRAYQP